MLYRYSDDYFRSLYEIFFSYYPTGEYLLQDEMKWWSSIRNGYTKWLYGIMIETWMNLVTRTKGLPYIVCNEYIYLIASQENTYKIGKSKHPEKRLKQIQVNTPSKIKLIHKFSCNDATDAESSLHICFHEKNIHGEWFCLSNEDVKAIQSIGYIHRESHTRRLYIPNCFFSPIMKLHSTTMVSSTIQNSIKKSFTTWK